MGDREGIGSTEELQARLVAIRNSISLTQLHDLFDGMNNRMQRVVKFARQPHRQIADMIQAFSIVHYVCALTAGHITHFTG